MEKGHSLWETMGKSFGGGHLWKGKGLSGYLSVMPHVSKRTSAKYPSRRPSTRVRLTS